MKSRMREGLERYNLGQIVDIFMCALFQMEIFWVEQLNSPSPPTHIGRGYNKFTSVPVIWLNCHS